MSFMALVSAEVRIIGTRPLLWHRFGLEALSLDKKARPGVAGNNPEEWRTTYLATPKGQLYLDPTYIFGAVRDGARMTSHKRGTMQPVIASTLEVKEARILIDRWMQKVDPRKLLQAESEPVYIDVRSVRNPTTRARNVRYRVAASPGWKAMFTLVWDDSLLTEDQMHAILNDSGQFKGIGDGRMIGFGRFRVSSFKLRRGSTNAEKSNARRTVAAAQA